MADTGCVADAVARIRQHWTVPTLIPHEVVFVSVRSFTSGLIAESIGIDASFLRDSRAPDTAFIRERTDLESPDRIIGE
jgi:hypothetical protein